MTDRSRSPLTDTDLDRLAAECVADAADTVGALPLTASQEAALLLAIRRTIELAVHEFRPPG